MFSTTHTLTFKEQPILQPIAGKLRLFRLHEDWTVVLDGKELDIPKGFETDLASIPKLFENVIDNDDPVILCPSIVHDYLFSTHGVSWADVPAYGLTAVNEILIAGMSVCGANEVQKAEVFAAVETGGFLIWEREALKR